MEERAPSMLERSGVGRAMELYEAAKAQSMSCRPITVSSRWRRLDALRARAMAGAAGGMVEPRVELG